jgi:hypothetical protein
MLFQNCLLNPVESIMPELRKYTVAGMDMSSMRYQIPHCGIINYLQPKWKVIFEESLLLGKMLSEGVKVKCCV